MFTMRRWEKLRWAAWRGMLCFTVFLAVHVLQQQTQPQEQCHEAELMARLRHLQDVKRVAPKSQTIKRTKHIPSDVTKIPAEINIPREDMALLKGIMTPKLNAKDYMVLQGAIRKMRGLAAAKTKPNSSDDGMSGSWAGRGLPDLGEGEIDQSALRDETAMYTLDDGDELEQALPTISEEEYFKKQDTMVNPHYYRYMITNDSLCSGGEKPFLLILVCSQHENFPYRQAIRDTWGSIALYHKRIKLIFLVGRHEDEFWNRNIQKEYRTFKDIVQTNFTDSYRNLTLKVLSGFHWALTHCPTVEFVLKSDEDMIINVPYLVKLLFKFPLHNEIMGSINTNAPVMRYASSKWGVSRERYPLPTYPPYMSGNSYVVSTAVARTLFETSKYVPLINIEDAYITGVLARIANVEHRNVEGFTYWGSPLIEPCDFILNRKVTGTHMTPSLMYKLWKDITRRRCIDKPKTQILRPTS
ncbi:beta-1,3-galactosyltransferase 1-like [Lineus longissimus]|uniref:beta-1,3-galactosyltransferase 1-like n=1 Tax=Lineus longissimus TaxID=88925 RepID=UPI002B4C4D8F